MKKIFIVDKDERFQGTMKSLCREDTVELLFHTSSMEVLPLIAKEPPDLVFVNLELPDISDFVMYDLLKKADMNPPIPVLVTYAEPSEKDLKNYKKLKFQPAGYHKKPLTAKDLQSLVTNYLGEDSVLKSPDKEMSNSADTAAEMGDEDDIIFTEILGETDAEDHLASLIDEKESEKPREAVFTVADGPSVDLGREKTSERELAARAVSLEKQNHFLRTENKRLTKEIETLKKELDTELQRNMEEYKKLQEAAKKEKKDLEKQVGELSDKQKEWAARDRELEKTGEELRLNITRLEDEKMRMENAFNDELDAQREANRHLQQEIDALKEAEVSLNTSISALEDEKNSLSQGISTAEEKINAGEKEKESLKKELAHTQNRLNELGELLQKALSLTKENDR
jgi:CheY-like chemotaxis protein